MYQTNQADFRYRAVKPGSAIAAVSMLNRESAKQGRNSAFLLSSLRCLIALTVAVVSLLMHGLLSAQTLVELPLDEGHGVVARDVSGTGHDGIIDGARYDSDTPDGSAYSLRFDGVDDSVDLGPVDVTGSGLTLSAWFKPYNFPGQGRDARLISKAIGTSAKQHIFMLSTIKAESETRLRARLRVNGKTRTLVATRGSIVAGEWYHAAVTYDGSVVLLFLDGEQVGHLALSGQIDTDSSMPVAVGGQPVGAGLRNFDGLIDDVRILQRALEFDEVLAIANVASVSQPFPSLTGEEGETEEETVGEGGLAPGEFIVQIAKPTPETEELPDTDPEAETVVITDPSSYLAIESAAPVGTRFDTDAHYLSEFLRQNPGVFWWEHDVAGKSITPLSEPSTLGRSVRIHPSGGNDTASIVAAARLVGEGGVVIGNGENFRVGELIINTPGVTFRDMPMMPYPVRGVFSVQVLAADVSFVRSPIDHIGRNFNFGFVIRAGADRFSMVDGGVINNNGSGSGALLRVYTGAEDIHIVGNQFGKKQASASRTTLRGIWWPTPASVQDSISGTIAGNHFVNFQSSNAGSTNGAFVVEGYSGNEYSEGRLQVLANSGLDYPQPEIIDPPIVLPVATGGAVSYAAIETGSPPEFCLATDNEYLGEFLRQNPATYWWKQNRASKKITPLEEPVFAAEKTVRISPSGDNDTTKIERAAADAGHGGVVDGNGETFKIDQLTLTSAHAGVTFRDINLVPYKDTATFVVKVTGADVTFIRSPLDLRGSFVQYGIIVSGNADRFALIDSGVVNLHNNSNRSGAALRIYEQVDDVYIVGNRFENLIGEGEELSRIRAIWVGGSDQEVHPKRGIIALNHFENIQSASKGDDADTFVVQGFPGSNAASARAGGTNIYDGNLLFMANTMVDGGKRMIKLQSGGVDAHSNHSWFKTVSGSLGNRVTRAHYDNQGTSHARWTNNVGVSDHLDSGESFFMTSTTRRWPGDMNVKNNVYKCNVYEINESTTGRRNYAFFVFDRQTPGTVQWPLDSEISNNTVRGSGELLYQFWFRKGAGDIDHSDKTGTGFRHLDNVFSVTTTNGPYMQ